MTTKELLPRISAQEAFDISVKAWRARGYARAIGDIMCLYRGAEAGPCLVGLHIPDDRYVPEMEGLGIRPLISRWPEALPWREEDHTTMDVMAALQNIHDCFEKAYPYEIERRLADIARHYRVTYTPPEAA
jgi:hypothetical protein